MRRYIFLFFAFLSLPLYSQNFSINVGGAYSFFNNINERQVSFYGYSISYSYYLYKKAGLFIGYDRYLPVTYYGLSGGTPFYITGGANSYAFGFRIKVIDPDSKRIEVNTTLAISSFNHKGSYYIEETLIEGIKNNVKSVCTGVEMILKKSKIPIAISGGYNFVLGQKEPYSDWYGSSVPFSSSLFFKAGISLPIMRGPVPAQIKHIEY